MKNATILYFSNLCKDSRVNNIEEKTYDAKKESSFPKIKFLEHSI